MEDELRRLGLDGPGDVERIARERDEARAEAKRQRAAVLAMSAMMDGAASALEEMGIPTAARLLRELRAQSVALADAR
jgi:hypothetical protein